ncbi:MAG: hypothetical protein HC899_39080, partial [Leptolyngbyaceae cyanobacterium SM1_4_3]|nr:hypothetical protein [Leptolyngbyaceae cyanobacterium SM1_4_3]
MQADEIELIGVNRRIDSPSGLFADVDTDATGRGGDIRILAANRLSVLDGAELSTDTFGEGDTGTLAISAGVVEVIGIDAEGNASAIGARVNPGATGDAQNLTIDAGRLVARDGGQISVSTAGAGNAGQLTVQANEIELIGVNPINGSPSGLFAVVVTDATGTDGSIDIQTNSLALTDGATIAANSDQAAPTQVTSTLMPAANCKLPIATSPLLLSVRREEPLISRRQPSSCVAMATSAPTSLVVLGEAATSPSPQILCLPLMTAIFSPLLTMGGVAMSLSTRLPSLVKTI